MTDLAFLELRSTQLSVFKLYSSAFHCTFHSTRLPRAFIIELKRCVHQVPLPFSLSDETCADLPKFSIQWLIFPFLRLFTFNFIYENNEFWFKTEFETRFTLEEIVPDSWWIRNILVPDWFYRLHTSGRVRNENYLVCSCLRSGRVRSGRVRNENYLVCSCLRRFWIRNLKWELRIRKLLNPDSIFRVNGSLSNPDIFPPAIFWVCGTTKTAVVLMAIDELDWWRSLVMLCSSETKMATQTMLTSTTLYRRRWWHDRRSGWFWIRPGQLWDNMMSNNSEWKRKLHTASTYL